MKSLTLQLVIVFTICILSQYYGNCAAFSNVNDQSSGTLESTTTEPSVKRSTSKTPRTIQRLVGGHLQQNPLTDKLSNKTTSQKAIFRKRVNTTQLPPQQPSPKNTTTLKRIQLSNGNDYDDYNDAALLEDPQDLDNWDNGILRSSAGGGKEDSGSKSKKKEEGKKTLSDQVAEGKYGLIEQELFQTVPKRPGVLSYTPNKEVPGDTSKNLGGLSEDDIWLAEDHLLVLKGGALNSPDTKEPWKPIDDYQAPNRQIKIPANPKVPPPFPVQFEDNGPIQFIGDHKFPFFYPFENDTLPLLPENGYAPPQANGYDEKNILTGPGAAKNSTPGKGGYFYPQAVPPPWFFNNATVVNPFLSFPGPPVPPGFGPQFPFPVNGSLDNLGPDDIDEDDPSLYYPPPYSFVYKSNYTNPVPPGPLVPGIVLPPPPNAFARLDEPGSRKTSPPPQEIPFRQVLTKISDYNPTTKAPVPLAPPTTVRTTTPVTTEKVAPVTIPFGQKTPGYYITRRPQTPDNTRTYLPARQPPQTTTRLPPIIPEEVISFVPKGQSQDVTVSKGNPVYYEYFDARKEVPAQHVYNEYTTVSTTPAPPTTTRPTYKPAVTHLRPQKQPQTQRLNKSYLPVKPYDEYLYITPQPEIRPNGISNTYLPIPFDQVYKVKPDFNREVDAIRQTLQFYQAQQIEQNQIPRAPKSKSVYEYSYDATGNPKKVFSPPAQYDAEPFKPMVQYSRPVGDTSGFKAIPFTKVEDTTQAPPVYYTTQAPPVQRGSGTTRTRGKAYIQPIEYYDPQQGVQFTTTKPPTTSRLQPWFSIEKQTVEEVPLQRPNHRGGGGYSRKINAGSRQANAYFYERPVGNRRQNNRYIKYQPEVPTINNHFNAIRGQLNQYQQQQQIPISLENDTWVNYRQPLQPINPDAEFVQAHNRRQQYQQYTLGQPQRLPIVVSPNHQSQYQPQPVSLHRDILVNYRNPLPPINPDSEFISPQYANLPQYRSQILQPIQQAPLRAQYVQQQPLQQYNRYPNEQSSHYYVTSRDARQKRNNQ